jgi:hypothetical protein
MELLSAYEGRTVAVRLSDVPKELREKVADEFIARVGLAGIEALTLKLAAAIPREDPVLEVPEEKWDAVREGRQPRGDSVYRYLA